jgi:methionyl-tRNA formyltransferase
MRVAILAPSIYSDRALGTVIALDETGFRPVGCVTIRTSSLPNLRRKMGEFGPRKFLSYAVRRTLAPNRPGRRGAETPDNPFIAARLARSGSAARNLAELCGEKSIPLVRCGNLHDAAALSALRSWKPDILVYTGGGILRRALLEIPRLGVVNTHAGVLPRYRGMNVVEWALLEGDVPGISVQLIDAGIDTGPVLSVRRVPVSAGDRSLNLLRQRVADLTIDEIVGAVSALASGTATPQAQTAAQGKQYFVMHETLLDIASRRLAALVACAER